MLHCIHKQLYQIIPIFICSSLVFFVGTPVASAAEQITSFDSHIQVNQDTSVTITETILYTTDEEKHGIYRYIPVAYNRSGLNYTASISNIRITDESGTAHPFTQSRSGRNLVLKIGDPDQTFTGAQTYVLHYTVKNALQHIETPGSSVLIPELYWDITGEGWRVDIAAATATITSEPVGITSVECYSGPVGSTDGRCLAHTLDDFTAQFRYPHPITYGDNMTVAVRFDSQNDFMFPTATQKLLKQIIDSLVFFPLLLPGIGMTFWWWRHGRDAAFASWNVFNHDATQPQSLVLPWQQRPVPMVYEPFTDLTPGQAGGLVDERVDNRDVIAEIIDLARKKFLTIERLETKKLFGTDTDYRFTRLKEQTPDLPAHQAYLLQQLFQTAPTIKLSELKGTFSTSMDHVKKLLFDSLTERKFFRSHPHHTRIGAVGITLVAIVFVGSWMIYLLEQNLYWALPIGIVSSTVALVAAYFLPAKTALGTNYALQARGLQESIKRGAWREKIKEKHLFFEEVLPFAIALGVVDQLSKQMEALNVQAPEYLRDSFGQGLSTQSFVNSFASQAQSSLSYNPDSSSWGSSSSGGSSGGGGGGGGGGSW